MHFAISATWGPTDPTRANGLIASGWTTQGSQLLTTTAMRQPSTGGSICLSSTEKPAAAFAEGANS